METNKYTEALRLLDHCREQQGDRELHQRLDCFIAYLCDNFPRADSTDSAQLDAGHALLRGSWESLESVSQAVGNIPPSMVDALYPIAMLRTALMLYRIPLNPGKMKSFDRFHKRYGSFTMQAADHGRRWPPGAFDNNIVA